MGTNELSDPRLKSVNDALRALFGALGQVGRHRRWTFAAMALVVVGFALYAIRDGGTKLLLQRLFDGTSSGFVYSAMALSLVLIYKATGIINFAQGEMAMFGAFITYALADALHLPGLVAVVLGMILSAFAGAAIERLFIRPFDPANHLALVIVTLSLFLMLNAIAAVIWGFDPRAFPRLFPLQNESVVILGARLEWANIFTWVTVIVVVALLALLLKRTKMGLAFRAVSTSLESSRLLGIKIGRTLQFGWAIAAAVGTLAGCIVARSTLLEPNFMGRVLIYSFAAATLGGLDSVAGAVVAGILIGVVQTMVGGYVEPIGSELAPAVALVVIVGVLLVRPTGLFGSRKAERV